LIKNGVRSLIHNSFWSSFSNIIQNIFLSFFFIIIARNYDTENFGYYLISNNLYSLILGFASMGMGHWFIREYLVSNQKLILVHNFFNFQFIFSFLFYSIFICLAYFLYHSGSILILSVIIGFNLIFDNLIYVIKTINIAELKQKNSSVILVVESINKLSIVSLLFFIHIDIFQLSFTLLLIRISTLILFIKYGNSKKYNLFKILSFKIDVNYLKKYIFSNWSFIIISSLAVVNWRIGSIIVSKFLGFIDITHYEISFKLLSISYLIPIMITTSIYPILINANQENKKLLGVIYHKAIPILTIYGLINYLFFYTYGEAIIRILFGEKYIGASYYTRQLFLVILVFPTIFLQANVLLTIKKEKIDMLCNIVSICLNICISMIGIKIIQSLSVVNLSIFISFIVFHLIQDIILIKNKITRWKNVISFYGYTTLIIISFIFLSIYFNVKILLIIYIIVLLSILIYFILRFKLKEN
jgi:O-antigen/teichoic acid export membrane protein